MDPTFAVTSNTGVWSSIFLLYLNRLRWSQRLRSPNEKKKPTFCESSTVMGSRFRIDKLSCENNAIKLIARL